MSPAEHRHRHAALLGAILLAAFALRVWGAKHGLPYVFNADENAHFVPKAIGMFGHSYNPDYFINPPGYTYLLHVLFFIGWGGRTGIADAYATDPGSVFLAARIASAVLGTAAVWLTCLAGTRLFGRGAGLLAGGLMAVAFLPVFYSHLALNDVPALAPLALSLWGTAGILRHGRRRDFALAGIGLGLAAATKYTAGIVLLPLLAAAWLRLRDEPARRRELALLAGAALALAAAAFVAANPYSVLDPGAFRAGLDRQSSASGEEAGKLGLTDDNGIAYYLWSLTWGLGWAPAILALAGAVLLLRDRRREALLLLPAVAVFIVFMGSQERYFGRWLMPLLPVVALLAAHGAARLAELVRGRRPALGTAAWALAAAALLAQGLVHSVHGDAVLARDDTRALARAWLVANVPAGSKVVIEPIAPDQWAMDVGRPSPETSNGNRWIKWRTARSAVDFQGRPRPGGVGMKVNIEDYERILRPALIDSYERGGFCWVVTGSTQRGRAEAEPAAVPRAIAYYRELERRGRLVHRASPYDEGAGPVRFSFDMSFNTYPLAYARPGPDVRIYRLSGGACA